MKKIITIGLVLGLSLQLLTGCGGVSTEKAKTSNDVNTEKMTKQDSANDTKVVSETADTEVAKEEAAANEVAQANLSTPVRVAALKGPTAMGMVKLMSDAESDIVGGNSYEFSIAASPDEVTLALVQGEIDIAAVPANLSSVLYHKMTGDIQVLGINTLGVLYLAEFGESVNTVEDLRGKTIYASGKGSIPEYALMYLLSSNGIDPDKDVTIEWKTEHTECVAALAAKEGSLALLPQPFMTIAMSKNEKISEALDLNQEWEKLQESSEQKSGLITGVVVARKAFIQDNPEAVNSFLDSYRASVDYVNESIEDAAALVEKYDIVAADVAKKAIPKCNIVLIEGAQMKEMLSGYLTVLMEQNPKSIGGEIPSDEFYYER